MTARRFAEGTAVSVESSRGEITGLLTKHGVQRMAWASEPEGDQLTFELAGHRFLFRIERPTAESLRAQWIADGKPPTTTKWLPSDNQVAAEWRRRWRANVLLLKAKLEFAEGEASTVMRELMPYALLRDGRTLEEAIVAGDSSVPLLGTGR
jgi:hypothetical protein